MMRHCDGNDPNLLSRDQGTDHFSPCKCGQRFNDDDHSVIYPHPKIRLLSDLDRDQIEEIVDRAAKRPEN